ncbi:hypothetical protein PF008_g26642, partial [Phytophthora fragariae]
SFVEGLRAANEVLSRNDFDEFKAVMIFFSDGQPQDIELGIAMTQHIRSTYAKYDLKAFAVGFGRVNLSVLQRVASEMGGEYRQVLGANALRTEFQRIAAVLCNNEASLALVESDMEVSVDDKDNRFSDERGCDQDRIERINPNFPTGRKRFGPSGSMARKKARSGALVADKCFRLLQLKREVQDDARVMKAVMDEVNVLHLCRALGMAVADESDKSSMNKFDFGHFDPSSYDADFARFIRGKLIEVGGSNAQLDGDQKREDQLRVGCLFGKQMEVKAGLVRMGIWTNACESRVQDQGVYCLEHVDIGEDSRTLLWGVVTAVSTTIANFLSGNNKFKRKFRQAIEKQQPRMEKLWVEAVAEVMPTMRAAMQKKNICEQAEKLEHQAQAEEDLVKEAAFGKLLAHLRDCRDRPLRARITILQVSTDGSDVNVKWEKEVERVPAKVVRMYEQSTTSPFRASKMGTAEFAPGTELRKLATVKTNQVIAVVVKDETQQLHHSHTFAVRSFSIKQRLSADLQSKDSNLAESLAMLKFEMTHKKEQNSLAMMKRTFNKVTRTSGAKVLPVPEWFISSDDVDFDTKDRLRLLFGACHVSTPAFFLCEDATKAPNQRNCRPA